MRAGMARVRAIGPDKFAINIVIRCRLQFVTPRGDVFDFDVLEHQRLIAVIGNQQADRKKTVLPVILFEHPGHFLNVHRIGRDCNFLVVVRLMQRICAGMVCGRRIEAPFAEKQRGKQDQTKADAGGSHSLIISSHGAGLHNRAVSIECPKSQCMSSTV